MTAIATRLESMHATAISEITAEEAYKLLDIELGRFLALVENLAPEDWARPTACMAWNVRDILAHQAGGYASGTGYGAMFRQYGRLPKPGQLAEDAVNAFQLKERAGKSPSELIAELRKVGPVAAYKWATQFRLFKPVSIPHAVVGKLSMRHLMWVIHSRDTWMHRLDICRATGQHFKVTREHDGRITELVMVDVAACLARKYEGPALAFELSGVAGGCWTIGNGQPAATIRMDVLDFNIFASGRYAYEQARPLAEIRGDVQAAEAALKAILVVY
jgi:uncharacterized protein (TIGR03083 family)